MNLYKISAEHQQILDNCYDENGEISTDALERLAELEHNLEVRGKSIAHYVKNLEADIIAVTAVKKEIAERETRLKKRVEDLKSYLLTNMEKFGITQISCAAFDIKVKKNPVSVNDDVDIEQLPEEYIRTKITKSADKIKIKQDLQAGKSVPTARLVQNNRLTIE